MFYSKQPFTYLLEIIGTYCFVVCISLLGNFNSAG